MPLPTQIYNTDTGTFEVSNNRINIKTAGKYRFTLFYKTYDAHSNMIFKTYIQSSTTSTGGLTNVRLLGRNIANGQSGQSSAEKGWTDSATINVTSSTWYAIVLNANQNRPYPSDTDSTAPTIFVEKLMN
jgi:hypothetical protein